MLNAETLYREIQRLHQLTLATKDQIHDILEVVETIHARAYDEALKSKQEMTHK